MSCIETLNREVAFDIEQLHHFAWTHGNSAHVVDSRGDAKVIRRGSGTLIEVESGARLVTIHFAVPTIAVFSERTLAVRSVILDFGTGDLGYVESVRVWDGPIKIAEFDDLGDPGLTGLHRFERFEIPTHPHVRRGIGISVSCNFLVGETPDPHALSLEFYAAGAEFTTKLGLTL